jgi:hypothetical protein
MTRHFSPPARDAIPKPAFLIEAVRCWREARDNGGPVQPSLFALLSRSGHDMLAPVFDSLLSLAEAVSGRRIATGEGACLSADEHRLISLVEGAAPESAGSGLAHALDCAIRSTRLLLARAAFAPESGFQAAA